MIIRTDLFERFKPILTGQNPPSLRDPRLLMDEAGPLKIYYAPFEYLNPRAKIVLVGITPGPTQMVNANREARAAFAGGATDLEAIKIAKDAAAFSGEPMRGNLIRQLNHWGFDEWLGQQDASAFFSTANDLVQTTSLLRYPVFVKDADYRGTPDMLKTPLLRRYLLEHFVSEIEALPEAVFVGLGPAVQKVLVGLAAEGLIAAERIIGGMLHPSPNCTYRINYLVGDRQGEVPHATNPAPYDQGRATFRAAHLSPLLTGRTKHRAGCRHSIVDPPRRHIAAGNAPASEKHSVSRGEMRSGSFIEEALSLFARPRPDK